MPQETWWEEARKIRTGLFCGRINSFRIRFGIYQERTRSEPDMDEIIKTKEGLERYFDNPETDLTIEDLELMMQDVMDKRRGISENYIIYQNKLLEAERNRKVVGVGGNVKSLHDARFVVYSRGERPLVGMQGLDCAYTGSKRIAMVLLSEQRRLSESRRPKLVEIREFGI